MPFEPGQSGNPGGRPRGKGLAAYVREQTCDGRELVDYFLEVFRMAKARRRDRMAAGEWLVNRGWGKPEQPIELSGKVDIVESVRQLIAEDEGDGSTGE